MTFKTKIRARQAGNQTRVSVLVKHPMRSPPTGPRGTDPGQYIERMRFEVNDALAAEVYMGPGVAANPLTTILIGATDRGDRVKVHWYDTAGQSGHAQTTVP